MFCQRHVPELCQYSEENLRGAGDAAILRGRIPCKEPTSPCMRHSCKCRSRRSVTGTSRFSAFDTESLNPKRLLGCKAAEDLDSWFVHNGGSGVGTLHPTP